MKPKRGVFSLRGWLYWQLSVLPDKDDIKDVFKSTLNVLDDMTSDTELSIATSFLFLGICFPVICLITLIVSKIFSISINDYTGYVLLIISILSFLCLSLTHYLLYVYKAELKEKNDETQSR
jgi:ATP/ADP translocase